MLKLILGGLWAGLVTAGSAFGVATMMAGDGADGSGSAAAEGIDYIHTRAINVPVIRRGEITGYVVGRFVFTVKTDTLAAMTVPPDVFVIDEVFRSLYGDPTIDFQALKPADIDAFTAGVAERVNTRLEADVVQDILVDRFDYLSMEELRHQASAGVALTAPQPGDKSTTASEH